MYSLELKYNKKHQATYILVALTTAVWILQVLFYGSQVSAVQNLINAGGLWGWQIYNHPLQIWRLLTAIFLHLSWLHFLMNMLTLFLVGRIIEEEVGSLRFTLIYLLSGIFANAFTFFFAIERLSAGASTSIFGIFGAMASLGFFTSNPRLRELSKGFTVMIVLILLTNLFQTHIDITGHIGGAIGGALFATAFPPKTYQKWISKNFRILAALTFILLFLLFVILPFFRY